ncbi:putative CtpA-like serine protease [mine drainage metagenome]|uniref:Putative CtpA-like serine protease n=1 Tax=mine drainage metagenome TaxID=410659 RepID=A0A1J5PMZ0_9ZZZZ
MREIIRVRPVSYHADGGNIGYIRISSFNEQTTDELKKAIVDISKQIPSENLAGYVIDLRNNPGGLLDQAVSVSRTFMARGEIVSTRGRRPEETQRFAARGGDLTKGKPLIVLINGGSASASEIVAGALHDHNRATLVGTRSFGKGSVQTIIPLGSGNGAMRLTTARYYTPSGRSIQALGISPDIVVPQEQAKVLDASKQDNQQTSESQLKGILSNDSMTDAEKKQYIAEQKAAADEAKLRGSDFQLAYAVDLLKGLAVANATATAPAPTSAPAADAAPAPAN